MKPVVKRVGMVESGKRIFKFIKSDIWTLDESTLSRWKRFIVDMTKIVHVTIKKFVTLNISMQAGTCTYITAIALIPIMMVILSILKAFGVFDDMFFTDIAMKTADGSVIKPLVMLMKDIMDRAVNIGGIFGLVAFILLAFSTFSTLEVTFNTIWGTTIKRALYRQLTDYMFLIIVMPIILSGGIFLYYNVATFGLPTVISAFLRIITIFVAIWAALFMFYKIMPNAQVQVRPVMIGAVVVALVLALLIWAVQTGVVNVGKANANKFLFQVLGPMVVIPVSLIFFNLLWTILLGGGIIIFSIQSLRGYTGGDEFMKISQKMRLAVVLTCVAYLVKSFYAKKGPLSIIIMATALRIHPNFVHSAMLTLSNGKLVERIAGAEEKYALMVDPSEVKVMDVIQAVNEEKRAFFDVKTVQVSTIGIPLVQKVDDLINRSDVNITLKSLASKIK